MERHELTELHYIAPIANVRSMRQLGILSNRRAATVPHQSVAADEIQERRDNVVVPGGLPLHDYVNLYFHARNPMMSRRRTRHREICVLRVMPDVLNLPRVVVTSQNASSRYVRWGAGPRGLAVVNRELAFARDWRDPDQIQFWKRRSARCAEVLVPHRLPFEFVTGAYVSCVQAQQDLRTQDPVLPTVIDADLFFQ